MPVFLPTIKRLLGGLLLLPQRRSMYRTLKREHESTLVTLKEKEAFNFALFQFNPVTTVVVDCDARIVKTNMAKRKSGDRIPEIGDIMYRDYASKHSCDMYTELLECIRNNSTRTYPELKYGRKIMSVTIAAFPAGAIITSQDITTQKQAEADRITLISELRRALDEVEQLRGLLPICASCKKIRDDTGYWNQIEVYISHHTKANFSHTICPDCMESTYPELWDQLKEKYGPNAARST